LNPVVERRATNVQRIKRQLWIKNTERGYIEAIQRGIREPVERVYRACIDNERAQKLLPLAT